MKNLYFRILLVISVAFISCEKDSLDDTMIQEIDVEDIVTIEDDTELTEEPEQDQEQEPFIWLTEQEAEDLKNNDNDAYIKYKSARWRNSLSSPSDLELGVYSLIINGRVHHTLSVYEDSFDVYLENIVDEDIVVYADINNEPLYNWNKEFLTDSGKIELRIFKDTGDIRLTYTLNGETASIINSDIK